MKTRLKTYKHYSKNDKRKAAFLPLLYFRRVRFSVAKSACSRAIEKDERISNSRFRKQKRGVWQRRFWEYADEEDFNRHIDYIHINPVKHGYVQRAAD